MVSRPVRIQVSSSPPAEPVCRDISAATMKMPDPIIEPTTIIVPSNNPIARTKPGSDLALVSARGCVVSAILPNASACRRVVSRSQQVDVLPGPHPGFWSAQDIADNRYGISPRFDYLRRALQRDASNSHDWFIS